MTMASWLPELCLTLLRLLKSLRGFVPRAFQRILGRLALIWSVLRTKLGFRNKVIPKPPSSSQDDESRISTTRKAIAQSKHTEQVEISRLESGLTSYTLIEQGEIIPLEDVTPSSHPFPVNIGATHSTHSLPNLHRSAHNLSSSVNNASRSSQHLGSEHSSRSRNSNHSNSRYSHGRSTSPYLHQPSRDFPRCQETTPTPHRQHTISTPNLEFVSPIEEMLPIGDAEVDNLRVPTRSASPGFMRLCKPRISPRMPEDFADRRHRERPRIRKKPTTMTIKAFCKDFDKPAPPFGWVKCVHPGGLRYFYNDKENVYTDADLSDSEILRQTNEDIKTIQNCLNNNGIHFSSSAVLVLDVFYSEVEGEEGKNPGNKVIQTIYHLADHEQRIIFFLDDFEASNLSGCSEISNVTSETHLRCEIEAQYWYFVHLFPHALEPSSQMIAELRDLTLYSIAGVMTSEHSKSPFTPEDLYKILTLSSEIENNVRKDNFPTVNVGSIDLIARFMFIYWHTRFLNFYGEANSRLERNYSVYGDPLYRRTLLIKTFSLVLFSAPDIHLKTLQNMWADKIMYKFVWQQSMKRMSEGWAEFVLAATVMLNANLAFLAIQSVDVNTNPYRSPAQISSYLSVTANIGSIVLGLLLMRHNRMENQVDEMLAFLAARHHSLLGLETLAILYSLPYALLMWGIILFLVAFFFMCFQDSSTVTRILVGSLCTAVAMLVGWCVWTTWVHQSEESPIPPFVDEEEKVVAVDSDRRSFFGSMGENLAIPV